VSAAGQQPAVREVDFLLLGGGLASATAAEALRDEGAQGSIVIVGAETRAPYQRPALSKRLLMAPGPLEPTPVLQPQACERLGIELLCGTRAVAVQPHEHLVLTDRAGPLRYGRLLIATGARPLRFAGPGAGLAGIHCLRDADDCHAIQAAAVAGSRAVVVGASFIGMEVAAALQQRGVHVTVLAPRDGVFHTLHDAAIAHFFAALFAQRGIALVDGEVVAFEAQAGDAGRLGAVRASGGQRLPCDFAVLGIGVQPDIDFLAGSGLQLDDGVVVDRHLQASVADVFAAGDVASFFDPVFNRQRRIEHWDNAIRQGRLAARNMLGQHRPYDEVSSFFCEVFDANFQVIGHLADAPERVESGTPDQRDWALMYLKNHVPRGLFTMGRPAKETRAIQSLIRYRTRVAPVGEALSPQAAFAVDALPSQTVLILQGGGAMGAFECGVVQALEGQGIQPDIVAGVSIGAFNGAIIAAHPRHAAEALASFWHELAVATPAMPDEGCRRLMSALWSALFGVPGFFTPRWWTAGLTGWPQALPANWTSFYDTAPARALLRRYVDFPSLRSSPVRLLVSAVDVETAELKVFDSHVDDITAEHIVASGSLPPGLPWTTIEGRHYWDGGLVSNSPLDMVIDHCGAAGKRIVIVDLFPNRKPLPAGMMDVLTRRDEIGYAERLRRADAEQRVIREFRKLVDEALDHADAATAARIRQRPRYVELMGADAAMDITRIVRESAAGEPASLDSDFSQATIDGLIREGVQRTLQALKAKRPAAPR
jgi:NTE family protein